MSTTPDESNGRPTRPPSEDSKTSVIKAVRNPLGFLTLGLLIADATLGTLVFALPNHQSLLVWSIIISFAVFVCIVVVLAIVRPEALKGDRPWQAVYSGRFADDLYAGLEGALSNLTPNERAEAWLTVRDVLLSEAALDAQYLEFCTKVSDRLQTRAKLAVRAPVPRGVIK